MMSEEEKNRRIIKTLIEECGYEEEAAKDIIADNAYTDWTDMTEEEIAKEALYSLYNIPEVLEDYIDYEEYFNNLLNEGNFVYVDEVGWIELYV
jgi:hypothetical protein